MNIELPYKFIPRPYQKDFFKSIYNVVDGVPILTKKKGVIIRPRRHGKDKSIFNMLVIPEMLKRVGLYYYVFPEYAQARKAFRENIDNDGFALLDHIPKELIKNRNNAEMKIELVNGSILRVVGTDKNIEGLVGSNPVGVVFSERALCNPIVLDRMKPMLVANGGRYYFVYTPRGHNHGYDIYNVAKKFPDSWALDTKTSKETFDNDGNRIFSDKQLQEELDQGMDEDFWLQEYFISFEASLKGAIYSEQIKKAEEEQRFTKVPYEPALPVHTFWDLGRNDATAIWFVQFYGKEIRIIDHYEMCFKGLEHFVEILNDKQYKYGVHYLPHDGKVIELGSGLSRVETLQKLGLDKVEVVPMTGVDLGISKTRALFKNMWFDEEKCNRGIEAIKSYVYEYSDKNKIRSKEPKHDWASHTSDALRYLAVQYEIINNKTAPKKVVKVDYKRFL